VLAHEASPAFLAGGATITRGWFAGIDRLAKDMASVPFGVVGVQVVEAERGENGCFRSAQTNQRPSGDGVIRRG
jgi:hypothetical protein